MTDKKEIVKILTPEFRVSFAYVFEPKLTQKGLEMYNVTMLIPKTTDISKLAAAANKAAAEAWATKPKTINNPIKDGDTAEMEDGTLKKDKYPDMAGHWVINASTMFKPEVVKIVNGVVEPIIDKEEFYSGCYAIANVNTFEYGPSKTNPQSKYGIGFGLLNIAKTREGEKYSKRSSATEDFSEFAATQIDPNGANKSVTDMFK